jgi:hypothetical protein
LRHSSLSKASRDAEAAAATARHARVVTDGIKAARARHAATPSQQKRFIVVSLSFPSFIHSTLSIYTIL